MKAVVCEEYGSPDVLRLDEVPTPVPKDGEVLVRVYASSINSWDWDLLRGRGPRPPGAMRRPKIRILGADVAGTVEAVGANVDRWTPGDEVFGDLAPRRWGGFAEFVTAPAGAFAAKPSTMSFEQAAATPQAAGLAVQGLRKGGLRGGIRVLLNGAGGGVGTFALQIAKGAGAHVTAVDHGGKLDALRQLGADEVIDYTKEDFARRGDRYDLVLDVMALRSIRAHNRALRPGGRYVIVGGSIPRIFRSMAFARLLATGGRRIGVLLYRPDPGDLANITELFEAGTVTPVIDSTFPLAEVPEAMRRFGEGRFVGKIVIAIRSGRPRGSLRRMWVSDPDPAGGRVSSGASSRP